MLIKWSEPAIFDLEAIKDYIARDSEFYAAELMGKILAAVKKLEVFPRIGREVPEAEDENIRELNRNIGYFIFWFIQSTIGVISKIF
jgi:toxin ParE1/3/4